MYHSTWEGNKDSILRDGLVPRKKEDFHAVLERVARQHDVDPDDIHIGTGGRDINLVWMAKDRWERTAGGVHLSSDKSYSQQNCLAGYEAIQDLHRGIAMQKNPNMSREEKKKLLRTWFGTPKKCVTFTIDIPYEWIPEEDRTVAREERLFGSAAINYCKGTLKDVKIDRTIPPDLIVSVSKPFNPHRKFFKNLTRYYTDGKYD